MSTYAQFKYSPVTFAPQPAQLDPVGKFRVSNPETLIDTDFEYGLQATKWETIELVNNIPFAYARQGDTSIDVATVTTIADSDVVRVVTEVDHNFSTGLPFRISGLRTIAISSEGVGIVTRIVNTTSFEYKSRRINLLDASVETENTQLVAGAFYSASHFKLNELDRIFTDGAANSTITVNFNGPHGFIVNTAFYIINSVAGKKQPFNSEAYVSTDGVEVRDTVNVDINIANGTTYVPTSLNDDDGDTITPYIWTSAEEHQVRLIADDFNVSTDVFEFPFEHGIGNNSPVMVIPPIDWMREEYPNSNSSYGWTITASGNWQRTNGRFMVLKYVRTINATAFRLYPNTTASSAQYTNFTKTPEDYGLNFIITPCFPVTSASTNDRIRLDLNRRPKYANGTPYALPAVDEEVITVGTTYGVIGTGDGRTYNRHTRGRADGYGISYKPKYVESIYDADEIYLKNPNGTRFNVTSTTLDTGRRDNSYTCLVRTAPVEYYDSFYSASHNFVNGDVIQVSYSSANVNALKPGYNEPARFDDFVNNTSYFASVIDGDRFRLTTNTGQIIQVYRQPKDINVNFTAIRSNPLANRFVINAHGISDGTPLVYNANSSTVINGLADAATYYVHRATTNSFLLATTEDGRTAGAYQNTVVLGTSNVFITTASTNGVIRINSPRHAFTNGDYVQIIADDPPTPLANGDYYYLKTNYSTTNRYFRLFRTKADYDGGTNWIRFLDRGTGTMNVISSSVVDLLANGSGTQSFNIVAKGAADGVYNVTSVGSANSLSFELQSQVEPKEFIITANSTTLNGNNQTIRADGHGLVTGLPLTYDLEAANSTTYGTEYHYIIFDSTEVTAGNSEITIGVAGVDEFSYITDSNNFATNGAIVKLLGENSNNTVTGWSPDTALELGTFYYMTNNPVSNTIQLFPTIEDAQALTNPIVMNGDQVGEMCFYFNDNLGYKFADTAQNIEEELSDVTHTVYSVVNGYNTIKLAKSKDAALELNTDEIHRAHEDEPEIYGGPHTFTSTSIAGEVLGEGTAGITDGSDLITGSGTSYSSYFREGDKMRIYVPERMVPALASYPANTTNWYTADYIQIEASNNLRFLTDDLAYSDKPQKLIFTSTGTLGAPIEPYKPYYYRRIDASDFRVYLFDSYRDAIIGNANRINITATGTGTYTAYLVLDETSFEVDVESVSGFFNMVSSANIDFSNTTLVGDMGSIADLVTYQSNTTAVSTSDNTVPLSLANCTIGLQTSFIARTEGLTLHRPHDGGVEMVPALSPDAQLTRQTRRYFRYQSGKGFQMSKAINFNAPTEIDTFDISGYYMYDITINDAGSGYSNGETIELWTTDYGDQASGYSRQTDRSQAVRRNAAGTIETNSFGHITKIAIANTGCGYWTANTKLVVTQSEGGSNSSGVNANLAPLMIRGSVFAESRVPHRLSKGLAITSIESDLDSAGKNYWNAETEVFEVATDAAQETVFYTNLKGDGASVKYVLINDAGTGYSNDDTISFTSANLTSNGYTANASITTDGSGSIIDVSLANNGAGYLTAPSVLIQNSTGGTSLGTGGDLKPGMKYSNQLPTNTTARGFTQFYVRAWSNSRLRAGMFDDQNGLFYEFDGSELFAVERSSVKQLSGSANVTFRSTLVTGNKTQFDGQIIEGDFVVIRGQSYKISSILSDTAMHVSPPYRGATAEEVIVSKTIDERVAQSNFSIDPCDGSGPTGYNLDINKIQMCYIDYAWYGAGKARFGFKDTEGEVQYVHEFVHNNIKTESYFRSGNLPARYEVFNIGQPDYVPALTHWGTSVIMDGKFDEDEAYLFTAAGDTLTYTGAGTLTSTGEIESRSRIQYTSLGREIRENDSSLYNAIRNYYYVKGENFSAVSGVKEGTLITMSGLRDDTFVQVAPFQYPDEDTRAVIVVNKQPQSTTSANTNMSFGSANSSLLVGKNVPLVSMRLGPSVDNSNIGDLGVREVINRMQLRLKSIGIITTHDLVVKIILNGTLTNSDWERLEGTPSLSQYIAHTLTDQIAGGVNIFQFSVPGGAFDGTSKGSNFFTADITDILALGNSIIGGNHVFPDGPDVLTIAAEVKDFSNISTASPLNMQGRISWTESQA